MSLAPANEPPVQRLQDDQWIAVQLSDGSDGTHQQRHEHSCLRAPCPLHRLATISRLPSALLGMIWKKSPPTIASRAVIALHYQPRQSRIRLRQDHLLHFLSLLHHPRDFPNGKVPSIYL